MTEQRNTLKLSKYLVLDIETEGLNPKEHSILEVGAIAISENLTPISHFSEVAVGWTPRAELSAFIQNMHGKNGLLDEIEGRLIAGHAQNEFNLDQRLAAWMRALGYTDGLVILAGNSVHFDHGFIKARMPETAKLLHYRVKDIGAVQRELDECAEGHGIAGYFQVSQPEMPHRGLADAYLELEEWQNQRRALSELMSLIGTRAERASEPR